MNESIFSLSPDIPSTLRTVKQREWDTRYKILIIVFIIAFITYIGNAIYQGSKGNPKYQNIYSFFK